MSSNLDRADSPAATAADAPPGQPMATAADAPPGQVPARPVPPTARRIPRERIHTLMIGQGVDLKAPPLERHRQRPSNDNR